jgi:hypothetical protein
VRREGGSGAGRNGAASDESVRTFRAVLVPHARPRRCLAQVPAGLVRSRPPATACAPIRDDGVHLGSVRREQSGARARACEGQSSEGLNSYALPRRTGSYRVGFLIFCKIRKKSVVLQWFHFSSQNKGTNARPLFSASHQLFPLPNELWHPLR